MRCVLEVKIENVFNNEAYVCLPQLSTQVIAKTMKYNFPCQNGGICDDVTNCSLCCYSTLLPINTCPRQASGSFLYDCSGMAYEILH